MINEKELIQILDNYKKEMYSKRTDTRVYKKDTVSIESLKWLLESLSTNKKIIYHSIDELKEYINGLKPLSGEREKDCYLLAKELLDIKQSLNKIYLSLKDICFDSKNCFIEIYRIRETFHEIEDIVREKI